MKRITNNLTPSMAVALIALLVGLSGSAVAATLITSKQIKDGTIQTKDLSKKTRVSLKGAAGPAGAQGLPGPKGDKGDKGDTGAPGRDGADFDALTALRSGETLTGYYGMNGVSGHNMSDTVNFRIPLQAPIAEANVSYIPSGAGTTASCPGEGHAAAGHLCIYEHEISGGVNFEDVYRPNKDVQQGVDPRGFEIYYSTSGVDADRFADGEWAVTAP